jgi:EpsI family protein
MSLSTVEAVPPLPRPPEQQAGPATSRFRLWSKVALVVVLVGASAGVRWVRADRYAGLIEAGELPPFPIEDLPMAFGPWKGKDAKMDSEVARVTGASGMASREYVNERTGVRLSVIVLYGPATKVYIHSPEVCYPNAGFRQIEGPLVQRIPVGDQRPPFASLLYEKGFGSVQDRHQVYYSWYYGGKWSPEVLRQKQVDRLPGMFKVHIDRRAGAHEQIDLNDPCVDFLKLLLPDLQRRIDLAKSRPLSTD